MKKGSAFLGEEAIAKQGAAWKFLSQRRFWKSKCAFLGEGTTAWEMQ
jgi:hypothetical protein